MYTQHRLIAEGGHSRIYSAYDYTNGRWYAVKKIGAHVATECVRREVKTLSLCCHQNVISLLHAKVEQDEPELVFSLAQTTLKQVEWKNETSKTRRKYVRSLLEAVAHCHEKKVIHNDIKPANVLIQNGEIKLADFGLAIQMTGDATPISEEVVTINYRAPELLLGQKFVTTASDVWSIGCTLAQVVTGDCLFPGESEGTVLNRAFALVGTPDETTWPGFEKLVEDSRLNVRTYLPSGRVFGNDPLLNDLILSMLQPCPASRTTLASALKHPFFTGTE